jgi:hypothetical protein
MAIKSSHASHDGAGNGVTVGKPPWFEFQNTLDFLKFYSDE